MDYFLHIIILVTIYGMLAMALNLVVGFLGILSVAHGAFFGLGAYTFAILTVKTGVPFWIALSSGAAAASLGGLLIAIPCLRLEGDYLALATFGLAIAAYDIFNNCLALTEGPMGIAGIPGPDFGFTPLDYKACFLCLSGGVLGLLFFHLNRLISSPWGMVLRGIRDQEKVIEISGKDVRSYKLTAFVLSAGIAGIAGAFYASYLSYIHPSNFMPMLSILALCMVVLGGLGSMTGSLLGAGIIVVLPELLRFLPIPASMAGILNQFIYGSIIVLLMLWRPQGIMGQYRFQEG